MYFNKESRPPPGCRDDPNPHENNGKMLMARDEGLEDISRLALAQLTALLSMGQSNNITKPSQSWLDRQEARVAKLHWSLRVPSNPLERLALRMNRRRRLPFFPQVAHLCPSHMGLDPRVIRNLTLLVSHECTVRTDRYRSYRSRIAFPNHVAIWLDRIDSVTAMWVGQEAFKIVFGYKPAMPAIQSVESRCEACIMAVVGARPQLLCDLRASILSRKLKNKKDAAGPRLLRIVDSWIGHYHQECREVVIKCSETLAADIFDIYKEMKRRKAKRTNKHKDVGKRVRKQRIYNRGRNRGDGLPTPTQPPEGRYSRRMSLPNYEKDDSYNTTHEVPVVMEQHEHQTAEDENQNGRETWAWLEGRMQGQGLTPEEREQVLSNVHPAFSDFRSPSAKPEPLTPRKPEEKERTGEGTFRRISELDEGLSWVSCTVHTVGDDKHPAETPPSVPPIPRLSRQDATLQEDALFAKSYLVDSEEDGEYVPPRREWATRTPAVNPFPRSTTAGATRNSARAVSHAPPPPPPPASSFYSEHSGFPRGHQTTEVAKPAWKSGRVIEEEDEEEVEEEEEEGCLTTWPETS